MHGLCKEINVCIRLIFHKILWVYVGLINRLWVDTKCSEDLELGGACVHPRVKPGGIAAP
jgi:hypothetical protein